MPSLLLPSKKSKKYWCFWGQQKACSFGVFEGSLRLMAFCMQQQAWSYVLLEVNDRLGVLAFLRSTTGLVFCPL